MDLNAYTLAMALTGVSRYQKVQEVVPEPKFEPFDLQYLRNQPVSSSQPRRTGRNGRSPRDVSEALPA